MNKKKIILILVCILLILSPFIYKYVSQPKYEDLDTSWGMGTKVSKSVSNDRPYEWYVDQGSTGRNAGWNCGPTSLAMVSKWQDENSNIRTKDVVDKYIPYESTGQGIYTYMFVECLEDYKIKNHWLRDVNKDALLDELDKGNIIAVGMGLKLIDYNENPEERVGLYYRLPSPIGFAYHFVIVKGYKIVDQELYFETYDPASFYATYEDGEPRGKNRYLKADQLVEATRYYFPDVPVIENLK